MQPTEEQGNQANSFGTDDFEVDDEEEEEEEELANSLNRRGELPCMPSLSQSHPPSLSAINAEVDQRHGKQLLSPAFSEDLGPASFSSSMLLMPLSPPQSPRTSRHTNYNHHHLHHDAAATTSPTKRRSSSDSPVGFAGIASHNRQSQRRRNANDVATRKRLDLDDHLLDRQRDAPDRSDVRLEDERVSALLEENDRLKKVVREVCGFR